MTDVVEKIFKFATAFDWFLIVASTLTSIGAGAVRTRNYQEYLEQR